MNCGATVALRVWHDVAGRPMTVAQPMVQREAGLQRRVKTTHALHVATRVAVAVQVLPPREALGQQHGIDTQADLLRRLRV